MTASTEDEVEQIAPRAARGPGLGSVGMRRRD